MGRLVVFMVVFTRVGRRMRGGPFVICRLGFLGRMVGVWLMRRWCRCNRLLRSFCFRFRLCCLCCRIDVWGFVFWLYFGWGLVVGFCVLYVLAFFCVLKVVLRLCLRLNIVICVRIVVVARSLCWARMCRFVFGVGMLRLLCLALFVFSFVSMLVGLRDRTRRRVTL